MTTFYEFEGQKFEVSEVKDCAMKVSIDGCIATISVSEQSGKFRISADDGIIATTADDEKSALEQACRRILTKRNASTKEELCLRLENLYNKLKG